MLGADIILVAFVSGTLLLEWTNRNKLLTPLTSPGCGRVLWIYTGPSLLSVKVEDSCFDGEPCPFRHLARGFRGTFRENHKKFFTAKPTRFVCVAQVFS